MVPVNRPQALVLGFFLVAWVGLLGLLAGAPDVFAQALRLPPGLGGRGATGGFLAALSGFLLLLSVGVIRRWRWTFWLVLVAFLAGARRVPVAALALVGLVPAAAPSWYVALQGVLGLVQLGVGLVLLAGYRRAGLWGAY
jgi:hypothetical protein